MRRNNAIHNINYFLLFIVLICGMIPAIYRNLTNEFYAGIISIMTVFAFIENRQLTRKGLLVPSALWCIYTVFLFVIGFSNERIGNGLVYIVFWLLLGNVEYLDLHFDDTKVHKLFYIAMMAISISVIANIIELFENPNIQKYVTGAYDVDTSSSTLGNTVYIFMMAIVANYTFDLSKQQRGLRKISLLALVATIYFMVAISASVISGVAATVMIIARYIFGTIHSNSKLRSIKMVILLIICLLALIIITFSREWIYRELTSYTAKISNYQIQWRVDQIVEQLFGDAQSVTLSGRKPRYELSWNQFLNSPIWGVGRSTVRQVGMHSQVLDDLARYGIIGVIVQAIVLYRFFKNYLIRYATKNSETMTTVMSTLAGIVVYSIFNPIISLYSGVVIFLAQYLYVRYKHDHVASKMNS